MFIQQKRKVKQLKSNNEPGNNDIPEELWKYGEGPSATIAGLLKKIWLKPGMFKISRVFLYNR